MSNQLAQKPPHVAAIEGAKQKFLQIADEKFYDIESAFAVQALMKNDFAMKTAKNNPTSVKLAMVNVASTGLTLNPAHAYAYLIPRDGAIVLDISYKGLIKIATDTGAVLWARADLVHEDDEFVYNGPAEKPEHRCNPFKERGNVIGVYCIAKTRDGDILTEVMDAAELEKIRGKSLSYVKHKSGPWVEWFSQMAKKAVIKRASKTWPYTSEASRLHEAIEIANHAEGGYDLTPGKITPLAGVWDECSEEEQEFLLGIARHVVELLPDTDGKIEPEEALEAARHIRDQRLGADEHAALWTRFNSRQRTALKKADEMLDAEAA